VGHNFGVGEQEKRGPKGRQQGVVGEGAVSSRSGVRCGAPAAESFSCILCH